MSKLNRGVVYTVRRPTRILPIDVRRFWANVSKVGECWHWLAGLTTDGYGKFHYGAHRAQKVVIASRFAYEITYGGIDPTKVVMHTCDTPACVRPEHLCQATQAENQHDKARKGRAPRGEAHFNARLTNDVVKAIRKDFAIGATFVELAAKYGIQWVHAKWICEYKLWRHV